MLDPKCKYSDSGKKCKGRQIICFLRKVSMRLLWEMINRPSGNQHFMTSQSICSLQTLIFLQYPSLLSSSLLFLKIKFFTPNIISGTNFFILCYSFFKRWFHAYDILIWDFPCYPPSVDSHGTTQPYLIHTLIACLPIGRCCSKCLTSRIDVYYWIDKMSKKWVYCWIKISFFSCVDQTDARHLSNSIAIWTITSSW